MQHDPFLAQAEKVINLDQIDAALDVIAFNIEKDWGLFSQSQAVTPLVVGVMNGAIMTMGHLLPKLTHQIEVDYCHATRYGNNTRGGEITWLAKPQNILKGRYIVLVDDIFDEGITLKQIVEFCYSQGAAVVKTAVLLTKIHDRKVSNFSVDYSGLTIDDRYVFGFGLDYKGLYRNAPGIFALSDHQLLGH